MCAEAHDLAADYEALIQFLYAAPIGLLQASLDGAIVFANPLSAHLLMPLSGDGNLTNLFTALEPVLPELRRMVAEFEPAFGQVCDSLRFPVPTPRLNGPGMLSLSLLKLADGQLMGALQDVSGQVAGEALLTRAADRFEGAASSVAGHARVSLSRHGCVDALTLQPGDAQAAGPALPSRDVPCEAAGLPPMATLQPDGSQQSDALPKVSDELEAMIQFLYSAPVGLVQCGPDGTVEMMNPMAAQLLMPLAPAGNLDNLFGLLEGVAPQVRQMATAFEADCGQVCESLRIANRQQRAGTAVSQTLSVGVLKLDARRLMVMVSDVTLEVEREEQGRRHELQAASRIDSLTQMPTRAVARERIAEVLARQADDPALEFAVIFINFDRFRQINDALGHAAGDEVLGLIAERLRATMRRQRRGAGVDRAVGEQAARLGGDEFLVVFDELTRTDEVRAVAQRMLETLSQPYGICGQQLRCTVSMGIITGRRAGGNADTVLQDASIAMVEAKRAGGNCFVFFEPAMQQRAADRSAMESDLLQALVQDQLFVVYQPVVGLQAAGGAIDRSAGVEALVRWQHPVRGVVQPIEFIGVAEACGLIGALGEFVLLTACRQFVQWQLTLGTCAPRMLAVNLSRGQLAQEGFVESVARTLARTQMEPARLQLEITESLAAQDHSVQASLRSLKALGLTLALDDFGTGYSSLASLHMLPVDTVKIDRSFVSESVTSAHHRVLIEATVRVSCSLSMGTVAEGIETAAQVDVVRELGCEKGQGYFFSRPLQAADLALWLDTDGPQGAPAA